MQNYFSRLFSLTVLSLVWASWAFSQNVCIVSGTLKDQLTGETLIGATVEALGTGKGNVSNEYGFYSISLPVSNDSVTLKFSYIGYESHFERIKCVGKFRFDIGLLPVGAVIAEVVVSANALEEKAKSAEMSVATISVREAKAIPALLGEVDIIKILQLKPGITPGSEGTTGLYVRGGNNDQNLIVLDEAIVYNANHLFGFFSTFNPDAVKDVKVYKGGFPAQYGGRLSSVIDVRMKEGNNKKFSGTGGIGLISSRLTLEGPIQKDKSSFIISGRRTYVDIFTRLINQANANTPDFNPIPDYYFYDLNTKVNFTLSEKDRLYISGYFGRDVFGFRNDDFNFSFDWGNATGTARWNHIFSSRLFANTTFTFSDYRYRIRNILQGFSFNLGSDVRDVNTKVDFYFQPDNQHTLRFGGNTTYHEFSVGRLQFSSDNGQVRFQAGDEYFGMEYGAYFNDEWAISNRFKLSYGTRLSAWHNRPAFYWNIEPRASVLFSVDNQWSMKASYARMAQYVHLLASSGLSLPTDIWYPSTTGIRPETSDQIAIGTSYLIHKNILITWEAWYKKMHNLIDFKDGAQIYGNKELEKDLLAGRGYAYSPLELEIEKKNGKLTGWIGYTLAWVRRGGFPGVNNGDFFPPRFDTRHNLSIVGIYELNKKWQFTATFVYTSGYITWLPLGRMTLQGVEGEIFQAVVPVYGSRNNFRYPAYHRLDIGMTRKFATRKGFESDLNISIYNATDRRNPYFIYLDPQFRKIDAGGGAVAKIPVGVKAKQVSLFPIIPSVTYNFRF